jgi:hypothetical protein
VPNKKHERDCGTQGQVTLLGRGREVKPSSQLLGWGFRELLSLPVREHWRISATAGLGETKGLSSFVDLGPKCSE